MQMKNENAKKILFHSNVIERSCAFCAGSGHDILSGIPCPVCSGAGKNTIADPPKPCGHCWGSGRTVITPKISCPSCHGTGYFNNIRDRNPADNIQK